MSTVLHRVRSRWRRLFRTAPPWVRQEFLGRTLIVRDGTMRTPADYDDAWVAACLRRATVFFDVGANCGYHALLAALGRSVERMVLIDPDPLFLTIAAENLIANSFSSRATFVSAWVGDGTGEVILLSDWSGAASAGKVPARVLTLDALIAELALLPDFVKIDVEGGECAVLRGAVSCAQQQRTRFLVEVHSNSALPMRANVTEMLRWCEQVGYRAWYLSGKAALTDPAQVSDRGRCHALLQPADWPFPGWLQHIPQQANVEQGFLGDR